MPKLKSKRTKATFDEFGRRKTIGKRRREFVLRHLDLLTSFEILAIRLRSPVRGRLLAIELPAVDMLTQRVVFVF